MWAQACTPNCLEYLAEVLQGQLEGPGVDQKVLKVDHALLSMEMSQNPLHKSLKRGGSIAETKGHYPELPEPLADGESRLGSCIWWHFCIIEPIEYLYNRDHKNAFVYVPVTKVVKPY